MRFLAMTGLASMLAWTSVSLLHGGDQAANEPAVLAVRGAHTTRAERLPPISHGPSAFAVPTLMPGGVVLVSDEQLTPQQLEAPLDWPSDIPSESGLNESDASAAPGRFQPAPTLSVVEPQSPASGRSILRQESTSAPPSQSGAGSLRVARRSTRPMAPPSQPQPTEFQPNEFQPTAPPIPNQAPSHEWRSSTPDDLADALHPADASGEGLPAEPTAQFREETVPDHAESALADAPAATEPMHSTDELHSHDETIEPSHDPASAPQPPHEESGELDSDFAFANEESASTDAEAAPAPSAVSSETKTPAANAFAGATDHDDHGFTPSVDDQAAVTGNDLSCRWVVPDQLNLGEQATCRMIVTNAGSSPAHAVLVRIELPKNVRLANADPAPNAAGQNLAWKIARLEPGQNHEVLLTVVPTAEGNVTPTATVTCTRLAQASIAIRKPQLEVRVEGGERLSLGQPAVYQLVVQNTGSGAAANVQLAARFTEGLHHPQGQQVRYRVGTLAAGETRQVQLPLTGLRPGAGEIEVLVATGDKLAAESKRAVEVVKPTLQVALSGPKLRYVDRKATYMLKVHNPGPAPADNVQLLEQLPDGMRFLEASPGGSFDPNLRQVAWFVGRLEPQQSAEVGVHVVAEAAGDHTLAAVAKADSGVTAKVKTMTKVEGVSLVVLDVVDRDDPIEAGSETAYEIRVTNRGSEPAHQVQVAARLPESMLALKASGPCEGTVEGRQVVFQPLGELAPGQSQTFLVTVKCLEAGAARFQAFFRSEEEPKALLQEETTRIYGE